MVLLILQERILGKLKSRVQRACSVRAQTGENLKTLILTGHAGASGGILANFRQLYICICSAADRVKDVSVRD